MTDAPARGRTEPRNRLPDRPRNRLLASLPHDEYEKLVPNLEPVSAEYRQICFDIDQPIEHVYFPERCLVSVLSAMSDGTAVETATVGHEGLVGLAVFLGADRTSAQAFVQIPGPALRMRADAFRAAVAASPAFAAMIARYTQALFTLVAQSSACNRLHMMTERCARWLLHTHDRIEQDEFPLTHQFLSQMLGVRRATVTEAMRAVQATGAITYAMGRVTVCDRALLENAACECYTIITREFDRLLDGGRGAPRQPDPWADVTTEIDGRSTLGDGEPRRSPDDPDT
jgi:CRP-like cAMP-binding protein